MTNSVTLQITTIFVEQPVALPESAKKKGRHCTKGLKPWPGRLFGPHFGMYRAI